jgi:PEP-CTERM motif
MRLRIWSMIAVVGLSAYPLTARAGEVIVSNLNQPPDSSTSQIDPTFTWAQEFTTGGSFNLQSIVASLGDLNPGNNGDFTVTAQLFSVMVGTTTPDQGTLLTSFTENGAIPTTGFSKVEFDPTNTVSLNASSFYWFVLSGSSSDGSGSVQWQFANTFDHTGPGAFAFIANQTGGNWTLLTDPTTATAFLIQVIGIGGAVPEPSSLVLGCMGFAAALFAGRRIKSRRAA